MTRITQRRLLLIRHAKALEDEGSGDHARPLNPRGRSDAALLGSWLLKENLLPELVLCSTATRTRETLSLLAETIPTILRDKLYLASSTDMLAQLHNADDAVKTLGILAHNPGLHGLLAMLVGDYANEADVDRVIMKFPTSACAVIDFEATSWRDIAPHSGHLAMLRWSVDS